MKSCCIKSRVPESTGIGLGILLLVIVIIAVLGAGCTIPGAGSSSKGSPAATSAPTPWTGSWDSNWGVIELTQNGDKVTGTYPHDSGKISGTVSGNTMTGTWSESPSYSPPKDGGDLVLTIADDGKSFGGNWRYGSGTGKWDGEWDAKKK